MGEDEILMIDSRHAVCGFHGILLLCLGIGAGQVLAGGDRSVRVVAQNHVKQKSEPKVPKAVPDKTVVLTFDDSVASHARYVGPYLKKLGFGATFFITEGFKFTTDKTHYMKWREIKALHDAGFEIGNHTRRHIPVRNQPLDQLKSDIQYIERQCQRFGIAKPVSFCYPAYQTSSKALGVLRDLGYRFARAGGSRGADLLKDDPLLLPQAFDAKPKSTLEQFVAAAGKAKNGRVAIMTFHGVPDVKHPWVSTDREKFEKYMTYLKENDFHVIALRDLSPYVGQRSEPKAKKEINSK